MPRITNSKLGLWALNLLATEHSEEKSSVSQT